MRKYKNWIASLFICGTIIMGSSCMREDYYTVDDVQVTFSEDTLRFDTVFTTLGSATRYIKVYNPKSQPILVDAKLSKESASIFRINADGIKGPIVENLEINGNDSIYIFVEVTIDPDLPLSISPFIINEQLEVTVNSKTSIAHLEAWGQNANYIPSSSAKGTSSLLTCDLGTVVWDDPKPYVIYGILYIDSCTLVLPPNTKLYVHGGVIRNENSIYNDGLLVFLKDGRLVSNGTIEEPNIIQGDRLESEYADVKSQWVGLLFWQESTKNILANTIIKNSIIGFRADSLAEVSLRNCQIFNTGNAGIIGRHASIYAENCLIYDNGSYGVQLTYGGNYTFNYCTVNNSNSRDEALILTDNYCVDIFCSTGLFINPLDAKFTNCIFTGSDFDEIGLIQRSANDNDFKYSFDHCAFRVDSLPIKKPDFFEHCSEYTNIKSNNKIFLNVNKDDYRLDTLSIIRGKGSYITNVPNDIVGKMRKTEPDLGCFEF